MHIVHAAEFRPEDSRVVAHALVLARESNGDLLTLHARNSLSGLPVEPLRMQARWGDTQTVAHRTKIHECCDDAIDTILDGLRGEPIDLLVVGTHQRKGMERLLLGSVSEALADTTGIQTLFVPVEHPGFVDPKGRILLRHVLIPVKDAADGQPAVDAAANLADRLGLDKVNFRLLHVGGDPLPPLKLHEREGWTWGTEAGVGPLTERMRGIDERGEIDLIVMTTHGVDSLGDALIGSRTQRVARHVHCPVLVVPVP